MKIRAIRYRKHSGNFEAVCREVKYERPQDFEVAFQDDSLPVVYLVGDNDLDKLRYFKDLIIDKGFQHEAKQLYYNLLGQEKIPTIHSKYQKPKHLQNAIETLLVKADKKNDQNIYIVAAKDSLFNSLWKVTRKHHTPPSDEEPSHVKTIQYDLDIHQDASVESVDAKRILDFMKEVDELLDEDPQLRQIFKGEDYSCQLIRQEILRASENNFSVLIEGESGTGKELVARAIHRFSKRATGNSDSEYFKNFRVLNCSAISPYLFEAILFGCKKDFPNRKDPERKGLLREVDGGTLFLDELGEMPVEHQPKLMRAVQFGTFIPVGYENEIKVDVRFIAATNRDLFATRKSNTQFRPDFYHKLSEISIKTPTLRSHRNDLPNLANNAWQSITGNQRARLSNETIRVLTKYDWARSNVRELENVLKQYHFLFRENDNPNEFEAILASRKCPRKIQQQPPGPRVPFDLIETVETLARASHDTWRKKREAEGWVYGPTRKETGSEKTNPDMVPYDVLTEDQKSYALEEAKAIIKTLLFQGYTISK